MTNFSEYRIITVGMVLCLIFMFPSCSVYHTNNTSLEEALVTRKPVKVVTNLNGTYEFKSLEKRDGKLLGLTRRNSQTAKKMKTAPVEMHRNILKFELDETRIYGLYLKNRKLSNAVTFGIPAISAAGLIGITNPGFKPHVGN